MLQLISKMVYHKSSNHHTCGIKKFYTTRLACRSLKIVTYHQRIKRRNRHKENHTICSGESQNEKPLIHQKNPDRYFRKYESQIILFAGAEHILQENGMDLKHLNTNKLQEQLSDLIFQKKSLNTQYVSFKQEIKELELIHQNLSKYLKQDAPEIQRSSHNKLPSL